MRHPVRPDVRGYETTLHSDLPRQHTTIHVRLKKLQVHAVLDHHYLRRVATLRLDALDERFRDADDAICLAIRESLEPLQETRGSTLLHRTDGHDRLRPEIADLEDPGCPLEPADEVPGEAAEELG